MPIHSGTRWLRCLSVCLFILSPTLASAGPGQAFATVPFENISVNPNGVLQAGYAFGDHAMIFCFESNLQTVANIQWSYKGQNKNSTLPVFLKTREGFDGQFADANGTIKITNTTARTLIMNCQFGF
ncbi:hypothetical protein AQUSIP_02510 [Aquicella siphonis]|uniref:Ig-like domain-containing protein n=1 Tax=Aquicella siphonis TaxID=254247 RepID=A0A5E4PEX7_9COXI|nr:hypothetical protein [Aquicella siphonis]VVC74977.1 hypothetical protein AQUSIP_02510 [Aquicella siphonis]